MNSFNFVPANIWSNFNTEFITYYGSSNHFTIFNGVIYFISDGCHIATKVKNKITYNPNFNFPHGIKKEIKKITTDLKGVEIITSKPKYLTSFN